MKTRGLVKEGIKKTVFATSIVVGGCLIVVLGVTAIISGGNGDISAALESAQKASALTLSIAGGDVNEAPPQVLGVQITAPQLPKQIAALPQVSAFTADVVVVKDHASGALLYDKNAYAPHVMASITKLMTALVLLETDINWNKLVTVAYDDIVDPHMYGGDEYMVQDVWFAGIAGSSNRAMQTLADSTGWPREAFVARMNEKAVELGMTDTTFVEPTGLSNDNISTGADVALLLAEAMNHEMIQRAMLQPTYTLRPSGRNSHTVNNTNWLLHEWTPHDFFVLRGGKTGYIPASGYNFTMQVEDEDTNLLDVVVLGADYHESRFTEARDIASSVYDAYIWPNNPDYVNVETFTHEE